MNIEELENLQTQHYLIWKNSDKTFYSAEEEHTKLSIQFAISLLEELEQFWIGDSKMIYVDEVQGKIQELKQYLDDKS